jgi:dCMP deaminase
MTCQNCDPKNYYYGKVIETTDDLEHCAICKEKITKYSNPLYANRLKWDEYFYTLCKAISSKSPCLSRKIGAVLVRDHSIVSTGYNGPPRGIPHCGHDRFMKDEYLSKLITADPDYQLIWGAQDIANTCPRRLLQYESGEGMELCPAQHAEENAVSNAARIGASVIGTTLYMNCVIPCQKCFGTLINAGIVEIVVESIEVYDKHTKFLIDNSNIKIRKFLCL